MEILLDNLPDNFEFPIFINPKKEESKATKSKFSIKELEDVNSTVSIIYKEAGNSLILSIYGPKECKFKSKAKNDECLIEVYIKSNLDTSREISQLLNEDLKKFCESFVLIEEYPRCIISIVANIISQDKDFEIALFNATSLAFALSGIDLDLLCLASEVEYNEKSYLVFLDANNTSNIHDIRSNSGFSTIELTEILSIAKVKIEDLYKSFKCVMSGKLKNY